MLFPLVPSEVAVPFAGVAVLLAAVTLAAWIRLRDRV
jgi:hypothetical protein